MQADIWLASLVLISSAFVALMMIIPLMKLKKSLSVGEMTSEAMQIILRSAGARQSSVGRLVDSVWSFRVSFFSVLLGEFVIFTAYRLSIQHHLKLI